MEDSDYHWYFFDIIWGGVRCVRMVLTALGSIVTHSDCWGIGLRLLGFSGAGVGGLGLMAIGLVVAGSVAGWLSAITKSNPL
jgi:hypothetical protein